jgi:hypothetical protein
MTWQATRSAEERRQIGELIVDGYRRQPQTEEELRGLDEESRALVNEEVWEVRVGSDWLPVA